MIRKRQEQDSVGANADASHSKRVSLRRAKYPVPATPPPPHTITKYQILHARHTLAFSPSLAPARDCRAHPARQRIWLLLHWYPARREQDETLAHTGKVQSCSVQRAGREGYEGRVPEGWRMSDALPRCSIQGWPPCASEPECEPVSLETQIPWRGRSSLWLVDCAIPVIAIHSKMEKDQTPCRKV
ncbi:uncharacterized protein N7477_007363 [Penicillium maclennaniae]|uniref:uncharacterized protein n=1 Tax=Penicillium maclennaniae TaxID=1343394 RepID=UPI002540F8A9|nr:uncharacterized protein N7477_007363 [Penicillium maclennaniae]KAJ5664915.1 hypothetical protein N7477_007363 [Penicillium maclennaniae]